MKKELFGFNRALVFEYQYEPVKILVYFKDVKTHHLGAILINGSTINDIINTQNIITDVRKEFKDNNNHLEFFRTLYSRLSELYVLQHIQLSSFTESKKGMKNKATEVMKQREFNKPKKKNKQKKEKFIDVFPSVHDRTISNYIKLIIDTENKKVIADIDGKEKAVFKYRKSWSHKRYIDNIFNNTNITPSWDFNYGWEYVS